MIPRTFHRIWLGANDGDPIPERFDGYWRRFQDLHPNWDFVTWDDPDELDWMIDRGVFDAATTHAGRADVLRYELMYKVGGVYVDTDVEPLRPFDALLEEPTPFAGWENNRLLCITVLGSPPGHPAFKAVLDFLPRWSRTQRPNRPNYQTGPEPFTRVWRQRRDVRKLEREAFYPVGWWEKHRLGGPYPAESYAVHHWNAGWKTPEQQRA